ncbi:MAG TPA: hypothetical protein VGQ06_00530 [Gemmatimonadales bacterium]|nr:hypothetical protein [Gemmatimonadales bacterium]
MTTPAVARGTCYALFAYEVAHAIDLAAAETRLASATQRQTVKQKRRAPAFFEYNPAPLRVTEAAEPLAVGARMTAPSVELVLYDFGAVSVSYAIPLEGPLAALPELSAALYGNELLEADARRRVQRLLETLGDAALRTRVAEFVEDYVIFEIEAFAGPCEAALLWTEQAQTVAQILRAEPRTLSQQEVSDALALRLSFGVNDATIIDTDVALLFDAEGEDVRAVIEFTNTQLLEMRYLDAQLDGALEQAYEVLGRRRVPGRFLPSPYGPALRRLGRLQLDAAVLFEQVTNALKLIGDQYLTRVYGLVSRRFHLAEWDASISRKLQTLDSIYGKLADRAASFRMELLEWIIILLIAVSIALPFVSGLAGK